MPHSAEVHAESVSDSLHRVSSIDRSGGDVRRSVAVGLGALLSFVALPSVAASASGGTIAGTVTAAATGSAAGQVCVAFLDSATSNLVTSVLTAADGTYSAGVPAGSYEIRFDDCDGGDLVEQYWHGVARVWEATTVSVADGATLTGIDAAMAAG